MNKSVGASTTQVVFEQTHEYILRSLRIHVKYMISTSDLEAFGYRKTEVPRRSYVNAKDLTLIDEF